MYEAEYEALDTEVRAKAAENGFPCSYPAMFGILKTMLIYERQDHARELKRIKEEKNPDKRLENLALEVRACSLDSSEERDELVHMLKEAVRDLEDLEIPEGGIDFEDLAYETQRDFAQGLV